MMGRLQIRGSFRIYHSVAEIRIDVIWICEIRNLKTSRGNNQINWVSLKMEKCNQNWKLKCLKK